LAPDTLCPMYHALRSAAALLALTLPPLPAAAQYYERHWHTGVVAAPVRATPITTSSLSPAPAQTGPALRQAGAHALTGIASYYWQEQMTSSGERFNRHALTAAHRTLPMHTRVKVTHLASGRSVIVRINDRGPFKPGRIIDVSDRAAEILGFKPRGLAQVRVEVVR
jgi:rare lipoprotein A